jgi:PAS domain S-box-containing protein
MRVLQSSLDAIIVVDEELRIRVFNPVAERLFGCASETVLGTSIERLIPQRLRVAYVLFVKLFDQIGMTRRTGITVEQLCGLRADGTEFQLEGSISRIRVDGRKHYTLILHDSAERLRAAVEGEELDGRLRLMADAAPVMLWTAGPDKLRTYCNRGWRQFTGRPLEAELGSGWTESIHPDDMTWCMKAYEQAFDRRESVTVEYRLRRHDGEYRWVVDSAVPYYAADGSFAGYVGSAIDITSHKEAEAAVADVSRKLVEAHESERTRLARELHDDIAQRMAVLTMDLDTLAERLPLRPDDLSLRIRALADRAIDLAKDIQGISHSLHSSKLDYIGVAAAAAAFCREVSQQHHVDVAFTHHGVPDDVPNEVAVCVFRVLQEAVHNAVKHAGVQSVAVDLRGSGHDLHLEVRDAGVGFEPDAALRGPGFGLVGMQERMRLADGELALESRPGAGATIRARVPLHRSSAALAGAG